MPAKQRKSDKRRPSQSEENELGMSEGGKPGRDAMVEVDGGEGTEAPNEVGAQSSQPSALPKSEGDEDTGDGAEASEANAKLQELKAKAASGKKLSNKERRLLQKYQEMADLQKETAQAEAALEENPYGEFLKNFSVILRGQNANAESGAHAQCLKADRFSISGKTKPLFTDASFSLSAGRRYGLVGPNGEGKSVLMKHIAAGVFPLPPGWDVLYVGQEVPASSETVADAVLSADRRRALILREEARLMEEMEGEGSAQWSDAMWEEKVKRLQELGDEAEALDAHGAEARVRIVLSGLGFKPEEADLPVSRFSGGWRMRVAIAQALLVSPRLLLLDEPTNHLDVRASLWLSDRLAKYDERSCLLVASHDADLLDEAATDCLHLESRGLRHYRGGFSDLLAAREQLVAQKTKQVQKEAKEKEKEKGGKGKNQGKGGKAAVSKDSDDENSKGGAPEISLKAYKVKFDFKGCEDEADDPGVGLSVRDVSFTYPSDDPKKRNQAIFSKLNFRLDASSKVALVGANGSGKSTLLRLLAGVLEPSQGEVEHGRQLRFAFCSQHFEDVWGEEAERQKETPVGFLCKKLQAEGGAGGRKGEEEARKLLGMFGLEGKSHLAPLSTLSGGQKARTSFAAAAAIRPHLLLLDEPTNHLDIESIAALVDALCAFPGGVVVATHDARLMKRLEAEVWLCGGGEAKRTQGGFDAYRRGVLRELQTEAERAEQEAKRKRFLKEKRRQAALEKAKTKR